METFVQFETQSEKWLRGMIHRPERVRARRGGPGVVFFHGITGDRMESPWLFVKCWPALDHPTHLRQLAESAAVAIPAANGGREYCAHTISPSFLETIDQVDPLKAIASFQAPTLIIHPEKDEHLPLSHPEDYFQAVGSAIKEKVIVHGADHTFTSVAWEREVIDRTVAWFTTHLLKPLR